MATYRAFETHTLYNSLRWRCIGPYRGSRCGAVAGDVGDPMTFYFGSTGGGVWKTTDGGNVWENVSDGYFRTASVGAIAVSELYPSVIYAGMGESNVRGNVAGGDGVYKSVDGGRTWEQMGLRETRHIGRIRIHPRSPDVVYVAALGHAFGSNPERGVFRSRDGGQTWEKVLYCGEDAGAIDLAMEPQNPLVLYAATWDVRRSPWNLRSGGPGSGIYKTTNGGDTWTELSEKPGLPAGVKGRIGLAVSPARPGRVWAVIEAHEGGVFRSDDYGESWSRTHEGRGILVRPWYFNHIIADPVDPDVVYLLSELFWKSTDGGTTFRQLPTPHRDHHDLWIDPKNPRRMIQGNDGGACVSFNGGASWSSLHNQPTAEIYHVAVDNDFPYRVYGSQQDNASVSVPSQSDRAAITAREIFDVGGGESGYIAVRHDDPNVVYAGTYDGIITRYDRRAGQRRIISPWPESNGGWAAKDRKYRFQWTFPIVVSPHDSNVLYAGANHVFRTTNEGSSWEIMSPDLTRNDVTKLESSGGPITKDNTSVEVYCTIFALAESPVEKGVLWAGSNDGLVHVSRDNGESWTNVTPPELPEWALVSIIEPSQHAAGKAYIAATGYKLDDLRPYLLKTTDFGQTWHVITTGIPEGEFTRVIREDTERPGLLYAGTEAGAYVSFDDGGQWHPLRLNLPVVPVHDLAVKENDLVAATHGRSFWILEDLTVLRQIAQGTADSEAILFKPRATYRHNSWSVITDVIEGCRPNRYIEFPGGLEITYSQRRSASGQIVYTFYDAGTNPVRGVTVHYVLQEAAGDVVVTFLDADGNVIREFSSARRDGEPQDINPWPGQAYALIDDVVPTRAGANRFVWNLRYPGSPKIADAQFVQTPFIGPLAPPGRYQVRLAVSGRAYTQEFEVLRDPRITATPQTLRKQFELHSAIRDKASQITETIRRCASLRAQLDEWVDRVRSGPGVEADTVGERAGALKAQLTAIEDALVQSRARSGEDLLNYPPMLNSKLAHLAGVVGSADEEPTQQSYEVFEDLSARVDTQIDRLREVIEGGLRDFNALIAKLEIPAVVDAGRV